MKFTLIILTVLAPFFAHAGGGGGLRPGMQTMMMKSPEIVYSIRQTKDSVFFAHALFINNKWQVENIALQKNDFNLNDNIEAALKLSHETKEWIEIK